MEYDDETAQANLHQSSTDMRPAAQNYRNRGWAPLPLRPNNKAPIAKNWTQLVVDDDTDWPGNVGVRLGAPSGGVVDMDLDCEEALLLASAVLPRTGTIFGRPGSPRAHWFFDCGESAPETATTGARFAPRFGEPRTSRCSRCAQRAARPWCHHRCIRTASGWSGSSLVSRRRLAPAN
jgi:hypothetical protein